MDSEHVDRPRILVAWDGTPASGSTFPLASTIAGQLDADVEVLHVVDESSARIETDRAMHDFALLTGGRWPLRVEPGEPGAVILAAAAQAPGALLVVLTTHVKPTNAGKRLGTVAEHVIVGAHQPVLLILPEGPNRPEELKRLMLPLDGTPKTAEALQPATDLAVLLGASLDVLYVADEVQTEEPGSIGAPRYVDQPHHEWAAWAIEVAERLVTACAQCPPQVPVAVYLANGNAADEIRHFAVEHSSDAIVLVRRSQLQRGRAVTLRAVLRTAPCPVLVLEGPQN